MPDTPAGFESVAYAADTAMVEAISGDYVLPESLTDVVGKFRDRAMNDLDAYDVDEINELCAA